MNIFRSLVSSVWQNKNAAEVVKLESGQLYLVRPGSVRSERECIYNDAMATVRRVPSMEHQFQLVITRVYEDEDQELLEDEEETDHERAFLIDSELEFRMGTHDNTPTVIWRDVQGDVDETFEFEASEVNAPTLAFFETCMYRAMYERKYRRSADSTTDDDLQQFVWNAPVKKKKPATTRRASSPKVERKVKAEPEPEPEIKNEPEPSPEPEPIPEPQPTKAPAAPATAPSSLTRMIPNPQYPSTVSEPGEFYTWNKDQEQYFREGDVIVEIAHRPTDPDYVSHIAVLSSDGQNLRMLHKISGELNPRASGKMYSFTWNYSDGHGGIDSYCVRFENSEVYRRWIDLFGAAGWQDTNQMSIDKAKADEKANAMSSVTEDVEMADENDDDSDDEADVAQELDPENEPSDEESEEEEEEIPSDEDEERMPAKKGEKNSHLTIGYKGDAFVVRGDKIGVFRQKADGSVQYQASIGNVQTPKGKKFKPFKMMLHDQDSKMIMMNEANPNSLFSMDIEAGKIVEEWAVHDDVPVLHMAPESKFAQMTTQQTLVGASGSALFRIDPRVSGNKMVDSQFKQYATKQKFSGITTTEAGKLAIGSEKGELRLFDTIGKNAKTALPPFGDPIIGIDVTANGRYIIATTKTYLLFVDTLIGDGRYAGSLGFDRSFPADSKPQPIYLRLRGEHVAYMNQEISFSPARFNLGEGQEENAIVTSTGNYIVAWDFAKVKKGQYDKYDIKKYNENVVQDNFMFGNDKQIVVALENNVEGVNKKNLKRPTRASLAPATGRKSYSGIVNSPY